MNIGYIVGGLLIILLPALIALFFRKRFKGKNLKRDFIIVFVVMSLLTLSGLAPLEVKLFEIFIAAIVYYAVYKSYQNNP